MSNIIADYLVILSLVLITTLAFIWSLPLLYFNKSYFEEEALNNALNKINDAIQAVYGKPLKSITLKIFLPTGAWIMIYNNTIKVSKYIKITLNDPNNIILDFNGTTISYKIKFTNKIIINENINTISIGCISNKEISIERL